jgi:hypothetical protein
VKAKPNVNVSALAAGVTSLFGVIGALTATGALGRLERNEPDALTAAVLVVLLGAVMLVIAGLPVTRGRSELFATLVGTGLTVVGLGWAIAASVGVASQTERPEIHMAVDAKNSLVKGTIKVGNLASDQRFAVLVEGLNPNEGDDRAWDIATLAQFYVGPDGDGKVNLPVKVIVPADTYASVGIRAWSGETKCRSYPRRGADEEFREQIAGAKAGCVVLPLPAKAPAGAEASGAAAKPKVTLAWVGNRVRATRARLTVTAAGAGKRVALLVAGRRGNRTRQLLRTVNRIGTDGKYSSAVAVRVRPGFTRLCARADLLDGGQRAPVRLRRCPLPKSPRLGTAASELSRPR